VLQIALNCGDQTVPDSSVEMAGPHECDKWAEAPGECSLFSLGEQNNHKIVLIQS
jgi:hypothetical protein